MENQQEHKTAVVRVSDTMWYAACSCGWAGGKCRSEKYAKAARANHEMDMKTPNTAIRRLAASLREQNRLTRGIRP